MPLRLSRNNCAVRMRPALLSTLLCLLLAATAQSLFAQEPLGNKPFRNFFVTGDYVVAGWVENSSANGFATGTISVPDTHNSQVAQAGMQTTVPAGADIVAAYLYWGTVEGSQSIFVGQQAFFNGYKIVGDVLGNPNAPTSWSSGGCTGSSGGSKTMRFYRADVRPYLPLDTNSTSPTFGAIVAQGAFTVKIADSGSNGNTQPNALGATLVVIYRVLSPHVPLNSVVLYDGSYAPSNSLPTMTQDLVGFYQPDGNHAAKITHIVANGQPNKGEMVSFGPTGGAPLTPLLSLYTNLPPFPGLYGGTWDNPTWDVSGLMTTSGQTMGSQTTSVVPSSTNSGCVNWGAMILSTTVQDTDGDGLLDVWEQNQGYGDVVHPDPLTGVLPWVALPGADWQNKDLFVEVDYLTLRDNLGKVLHSHLPKQGALDALGQAFHNQGIHVHFDLPAGVYSGDPFVVSTGAGGNEISESALICNDQAGPLCAFPTQATVGWKGDLLFIRDNASIPGSNPAVPLGNFQPGRAQSYRYLLSGHAMGDPRSYWGAAAAKYAASNPNDLTINNLPQLISIANNGTTATVTIKSPTLIDGQPPQFPPLVVKPGDCSAKNPPPACSDANNGRVTISGSLVAPIIPANGLTPPQLGVPPLNGTYTFSHASAGSADQNGVVTTTFTFPAPAGAAVGTYQFDCSVAVVQTPCIPEPQLGVSYLGPTSSSGHADFSGGGDFVMTLGLWGADNAANCIPDPSQVGAGQTACDDLVGTTNVQTGTLMHELGHTLTLTHGGTYYNDQANPSVPTYDLNCKPNFLSIMSYLFQARGFVDGGFDYSGQTLPLLNETGTQQSGVQALNEGFGLGNATEDGHVAAHLTRWYATPNAADIAVGDRALAHCDGTPLAVNEPDEVRVDGTLAVNGTFSAPLDWNNDLLVPDDPISGQDLNHNGITNDLPFSGFDDWAHLDLQQINGRSSGFGFSEGGGLLRGGGGLLRGGGGTDGDGGGLLRGGGGLLRGGGGLLRGGGGLLRGGGGVEQDTVIANSTVTAPTSLSCTTQLTNSAGTVIPACTAQSGGTFLEKAKAVPLTWTGPDFGQIRSYSIWRAIGSFPTLQAVVAAIQANNKLFQVVGTVSSVNTPPATSFIDNNNLKPSTTYTYFVTDSNSFGAKSPASTPIVVLVKF